MDRVRVNRRRGGDRIGARLQLGCQVEEMIQRELDGAERVCQEIGERAGFGHDELFVSGERRGWWDMRITNQFTANYLIKQV